jgi:hypothetical protein
MPFRRSGKGTGSGVRSVPEKHVVSALIEKRARVAGDLQAAQLLVMRLKGDLAAIDGCLRMFKAELDPSTIPPKATLPRRADGLPKGVASRRALEILRATGEALTSEELARRVLILSEKETEPASVRSLTKIIQGSLSRQHNPVVEFDRSTWPGRWRIL